MYSGVVLRYLLMTTVGGTTGAGSTLVTVTTLVPLL